MSTMSRPALCWSALALALSLVAATGCASAEPPVSDTVDPAPAAPRPVDPEPVLALLIEPRESWAIYTHGGDPAKLSTASFTLRNNLEVPADVRVEKVEYLRGGDCNHLPRDVASTPVPHGLAVTGSSPAPSLQVAPGAEVDVDVHFDPVEAAYVSCDRFVFRVYFEVNDAPRISLAETKVEREAPTPGL